MNMQMSELMMSSPHNFPFHFVHINDKNVIFQLWECSTCLNSSLNRFMQNNVNSNISWYEGHTCTITSLGKILKYSKVYVQNIWQVVSLWHQLTHLHIYIVNIWETSKCHNFLTFQPIFIKFLLFCQGNFFLTLSSEIKLNLFRISPLSQIHGLIDSVGLKQKCASSHFYKPRSNNDRMRGQDKLILPLFLIHGPN